MAEPLSLSNVQGDILVGLPKQTQRFFFFEIIDGNLFRSRLPALIPLITTAEQAQNDRSDIRAFKAQTRKKVTAGDGETTHPDQLSVAGVNIAFSAKGIEKIGITDDISDDLFKKGMKTDALTLGDNGTEGKPDWDEAFLREIHGVLLVTGDTHHTVNARLAKVKSIFHEYGHSAIREITSLVGDVRPGDQRGHEHFGYKDGVSQPAIEGVDTALPGQTPVKQGVVLVGRDGDDKIDARPPWARDGSFLAFRKLPQLVPEFDRFLLENAKPVPDPTANVVDLLGARLVGRWKSGAPIQEAPLADDQELGDDPQRNNHFKFIKDSQDACPFAAHIRKMNPRGDFADEQTDTVIKPHLVLRRGIPFGAEVSHEEKRTSTTQKERGLYFVCYQSDISQGFHFLQESWANNPKFPQVVPPVVPEVPGLDAIIGQTTGGAPRVITGSVSGDPSQTLNLTAQWVNSKGGEYFFSPSLSALKDTFAKSA